MSYPLSVASIMSGSLLSSSSRTYLVSEHLALFLNFVVFLTIFLFSHLILWLLLFLALLLKSVICSKLSSFFNCLRFSPPVKLYVILSLSSDFGNSLFGFPLSGTPLFLQVIFLVAFQEALLHCLITIVVLLVVSKSSSLIHTVYTSVDFCHCSWLDTPVQSFCLDFLIASSPLLIFLVSVFCVFSQIFAFNPCFQNSEVPIAKKSFDQTLQEFDAERVAEKAAEKRFLTVFWR